MNYFVTFYSQKDGTLQIANGFSFVRHIFHGRDLFVNELADIDILAPLFENFTGHDRIFCSLSWRRQFNLVKPFLDKRWVVGGLFLPFMDLKEKQGVTTRWIEDTFEGYMGQSLSSRFTPYFKSFALKSSSRLVIYNCSLGMGCYWNRCAFCSHSLNINSFFRPRPMAILEQIQPIPGMISHVWLGLSAIHGPALNAFLEYLCPDGIVLKTYIRADRDIIHTVQKYDNFENKGFNIGLESFSQSIVNKINKGFRIADALILVDTILAGGGTVALNIMDHYACMNRHMLDEGLETLENLLVLMEKNVAHDRLFLVNSGITKWPSPETASRFANRYACKQGDYGTYYVNVLPRESEAFLCNRILSDAIIESGIPISSDSPDFISRQ
jgi:hypothetical protein